MLGLRQPGVAGSARSVWCVRRNDDTRRPAVPLLSASLFV